MYRTFVVVGAVVMIGLLIVSVAAGRSTEEIAIRAMLAGIFSFQAVRYWKRSRVQGGATKQSRVEQEY